MCTLFGLVLALLITATTVATADAETLSDFVELTVRLIKAGSDAIRGREGHPRCATGGIVLRSTS